MKCEACGHWNRVPVNKIFIEQDTPEPKVKHTFQCMNHWKLSSVRNVERL